MERSGRDRIPGPNFFGGGDHNNPFTHTTHVYSDIAAIAMHKAARANDFARTEWKGTCSAADFLRIVSLDHESFGSGDVLVYLQQRDDPEAKAEAARILYPACGTYAGRATGNLLTD